MIELKCGIDASTTSTGVSILTEDNKLIDYYCIKPKSKDWENRVGSLYHEIDIILKKYQPKKIIIEDIPLKNGKYTIVKLASVRGVIIACSFMNNIPLMSVKVNEWRKELGLYDGTREGLRRKELKQKAIKKVFDLYNITVNDDIAESILIAYSDKKHSTKKSLGKKVIT